MSIAPKCKLLGLGTIVALSTPVVASAQISIDPRANIIRAGVEQKHALKVHDSIYQVTGFSNAFRVTTKDGDVIIDTSWGGNVARQQKLFREVSQAPIRYIVLTHAHPDHVGGAQALREPETKVIAQRKFLELRDYQDRLDGFFSRRNAAQFGLPQGSLQAFRRLGRQPKEDPDILFDEEHQFTLGGVEFQLFHTPGETYDHLTVWIPAVRAAFVGDNYYESFPNLYTLRGTQPRWALDYVASLNKILSLKPNIVLPSHGEPIHGEATIRRTLTKYRDAILYVHDATVKGMNEGKSAVELMHSIKLPPELDVGEGYGKVAWSVRGIFEGYAGWFDENPATMLGVPTDAAYPELVRLAGGPDAVAKSAQESVDAGSPQVALRLTDAALAVDPDHAPALKARRAALEKLRRESKNSNEMGWLDFALREAIRRLSKGSTER